MKKLILIGLVFVLALPLFSFATIAQSFFNVIVQNERHGLFDHEVVLNATNNGGLDKEYNFKVKFENLNSETRKQQVFYLDKTQYSWEVDVHEKNESSAYSCAVSGINATCYNYVLVGKENRSTTIEVWKFADILSKGGSYINVTAKKTTIPVASGESVLVKLKWNTLATLENNKKISYGSWSINPSGAYNTSYGFWRRLNITANISNMMRTNFTVNLTLPKEVVGNATANGDDIIVVYDNSGTESEIHRINTTPFQEGSNVNIWFRVQKDISAGATDENYSIYYNASNPALPLNLTSQIFSRIPEQNESGCVGGWAFREGAGTQTNDTCNGNRGSIQGNPIWASNNASIDSTRYGIDGDYALRLDGTGDTVAITDAPQYNLSKGFSVSMWINAYTILGTHNTPISKDVPGGVGEWLIQSVINANRIDFYIMNADRNNFISRNTPTGYTTDGWHHWVFTWDGTTSSSGIRIYKDAVRIDTASFDFGSFTGMGDTTANITIGASGNGANFMNGEVDEVAIYNYTLSPDNIYYHYWRRAHHQNAWSTSLGVSQETAPPPPPVVPSSPRSYNWIGGG